MTNFPLFPPDASAHARQVDLLAIVLTLLALFFATAIAVAIGAFVYRFRKGHAVDRSNPPARLILLELSWIVIPFGLALVIFTWASILYLRQQSPRNHALVIYVMGQQWMWKFQHPAGKREINTLHVPLGKPIDLLLTSQDVIHSLFIPALRIKQDAVPGRYTRLSFTADRPGEFHLLCAEYCGTQHSQMRGAITVMAPEAYERWLTEPTSLSTASTTGTPPAAATSMATAGERLFRQFGCSGCHQPGDKGACPDLAGKFGKPVPLASGKPVVFDEQYVQESVWEPNAKIAAGYAPMMPSFKGQVSQDQLLQLIAYLRSLSGGSDGN